MPSFAVRNYYNQGGFQFAEQFGSESRRDYLVGAPASVIGLADQTGARTDRTRYRAYGEQSSRSGTYAQALSWNGAVGYRSPSTINSVFNNTYVRARHYSPEMHMWTTRDPAHRQTGDSYSYVRGMPMREIDPSGLQAGNTLPSNAILIEANQFINSEALGDYIKMGIVGLPSPSRFQRMIEIEAGSDHRHAYARVTPSKPDWQYAGKARMYSVFILHDPMQLGKALDSRTYLTESEVRARFVQIYPHYESEWKQYWQRAEFTHPNNETVPGIKDLSVEKDCRSSRRVKVHGTAHFWRILETLGLNIPWSVAGDAVTIDWELTVSLGKSPGGTLAYRIEGQIEAFPDYEFLATTQSGRKVLKNIAHIRAKYGSGGSAAGKQGFTFNPFVGLAEKRQLDPISGIVPSVKVKCCLKNKDRR